MSRLNYLGESSGAAATKVIKTVYDWATGSGGKSGTTGGTSTTQPSSGSGKAETTKPSR